jgi:hypothetical protein
MQRAAAPAARQSEPASEAQYGLFYKEAPAEDDANGKTWYARGQNFIIAYSETLPGATFERKAQVDEWCIILEHPDTPLIATAGAQEERTEGYAFIIMPPGDSKIVLPDGGRLVRLFTTRSADLAAKCSNAAAYENSSTANIPPFVQWPDPVGGFKIRVYSLDVPPETGRLGRIWRCTTFMVNMPHVQMGKRDMSKLSPHFHDDFEQCSLALAGTWTHYMRWPWTIDYADWKDDVHAVVDSPSITVIPPPVVHTSVAASERNQLVDIFAPPRVDFSNRPGWVLNADDYPMP